MIPLHSRTLVGLAAVMLSSFSAGTALAQDDQVSVSSTDAASIEEGPTEALDPQAMEIVLTSARFLAGLKSFSFRWVSSSDQVLGGQEKITFVHSGFNTMDRDAAFVAKTDLGPIARDFYYDGKTFRIVGPTQGFVVTAPFAGGFDKLVDAVRVRLGTILPVWSIMSDTLPEQLTEQTTAAAYVGRTRLAGQDVHHIAMSQSDEDLQVWISTDEEAPVPLMVISTQPDEDGWPQTRVMLSDWKINPEISPTEFKFEPDKDAVRISVALPTVDTMGAQTEAGAGSRSGKGE